MKKDLKECPECGIICDSENCPECGEKMILI